MYFSNWLKRYHVCGRRWRIKLVDQTAALIQHRALIDRALVGDFAAVDRQRRVDEDRARDPGRRPRRRRQKFCQPLATCLADQGIGCRRDEVVGRKRRTDETAAVEIENDQRRHLVAVDAGNHHVPNQWRAGRDQSRAERTDADPGTACELEILGYASVEIETGAEILGVYRLDRIAEFVKAFIVERGG